MSWSLGLAVFLLLVVSSPLASGEWWNASHVDSLERRLADCNERNATGNGSKLCTLNNAELEAMRYGVNAGLKTCRYEFRNLPWGCRVSSWSTFLGKAHKESAFIHAVIAASTKLGLMRACASRNINSSECSCQKAEKKDVCLTHANFAHNRAKVTDDLIPTRRRPRQKAIHLHNTLVGRQMVENELRTKANIKCQCVGLSTSCMQQICWRKMPKIPMVVRKLKNQYRKALRLRSRDYPDRKVTHVLGREDWKGKLAFMRRSPDYCSTTVREATIAPTGRECTGKTCDKLCCGRGVRTVIIEYNCKCKFVYCCRMQCQTCIQKQTYCR